ncbi:hypothetical protein BU26DRAFT_80211 [Trematosphaeria pertusa]|uniref:Uncharacterized protein n=1 Tax=Trematosphaeria pertusa TaxID=390896 RepID=A0A6A6I4T0_9PLEO|nr:uncharacterized protein BU26DRAFT_80211 [Trematosphaeria pertusa]KAF2244563.1 hypothetical protein BU26DRAFT_80211 [Trematosphaeria pertusa]
MMDPFTPSPTPPLPMRNPNHRYPHGAPPPLPPLPDSGSKLELVPKPLFARKRRLPPNAIQVTIHEIPRLPSPSKGDTPSSPTTSFRSSGSTVSSSSSPPTSVPSSPTSRPRSFTYSFPPPDVANWGNEWEPFYVPKHSLRRKPSPKRDTLRSLRAKESEACLQRVYDQQLEAYLNGSIFPRAKRKDDLGILEEE